MKIQKILSILIILVMLLNMSTLVFATDEDSGEETSKIEQEISEIEQEILEIGQEGQSEDEENIEDDSSEEKWTDFSNAKFELKKDGNSGAFIEISGVTPIEDSHYYLYITDNSSMPNVLNENGKLSDEFIYLPYYNDKKIFKSGSVSSYVELNQNLYATIVERSSSDKIVKYGVKIDRYEEPKYIDAFSSSTFMSYNQTQIVTNFTHSYDYYRKIQIKVGKITDQSILKKIQNNDSSGFANLLNYAQFNSGIFNQTFNCDNKYGLDYTAPSIYNNSEAIQLNGLEDDAYYYLYVKPDDENGKYFPVEGVTLAQASVFNDGYWSMHFYGSSDFEWVNWGNTNSSSGGTNGDSTVAPTKLPAAGTTTIITILIVLSVVTGVIFYNKYEKYKNI